ncbi:unnamed protein product [Lampetra planeri]
MNKQGLLESSFVRCRTPPTAARHFARELSHAAFHYPRERGNRVWLSLLRQHHRPVFLQGPMCTRVEDAEKPSAP